MMMRSGGFIGQADLADLKARNPVREVAARYVPRNAAAERSDRALGPLDLTSSV
jgi:hypothetical protein